MTTYAKVPAMTHTSRLRTLIALSASMLLAVAFAPLPAAANPHPQPAGAQYKICNSGNSVSIVQGLQYDWPYDNIIVLPGSTNCKIWPQATADLRVDPDFSDVDNAQYDDVKRYRIRPEGWNTYGPWHCGEAIFDPPDSWITEGGMDIQTSGSNGTTC